MFDGGFRDILRREVDTLALPAEDKWVPRAPVNGNGTWLLIVGVAASALALSTVALVGPRLGEGPAAQELARVTPPVRPTVVNGYTMVPLPILYRNEQFRYNLTLPAWFREIRAVPSEPALLDRRIFTARSDADEARFTQFRPWDLFVEVYRREGRSLEDWTTALGCNRTAPAGAGTCTITSTQMRGASAVVGTWSAPLAGKVVVIDRGAQVLVLRYSIGDESNRPLDVTESTLDQIIALLGLV